MIVDAVAEMNFGRLRHDWDDPRVARFADALGQVNAIAERSRGFIWMLPSDDMEREQLDPEGVFGGDPRVASTLSVWESVADLKAFVFDTLHKRFFARGAEWFEPEPRPNFVMWPVARDHRPTMREAMDRLDLFAREGSSESAFGWEAVRADD